MFGRWHAGHVQTSTATPVEPPTRAGRGPGAGGVRRGVLWLLAALLAGGLLVAIEVGSPRAADPTGVDDLAVPWTAPDPADFVATVDHPWLPLRPGAEWVYAGEADGEELTRTVTVLDEPREVAGVEATAVREVTTGPQGREEVERWYAQDRRGHLWLVGEEGAWQVDATTPAGLAMAAEPRRGDSHVQVPLAGAGREVVEVGESGEAVTTPAGRFTDLLHVLVRGDDADPVEVWLARGTGVVQWVGDGGRLELVSHEPGEPAGE